MEKRWWKQPSSWVVMLIVIAYIWVPFNLKQWQTKNVIINDVIMYYEYLPATFIYKDLSFEFQKSLPADFDGQIWVVRDSSSEGGAYMKMTMGLSFLYAPFFLATYAYDLLFENPNPTGYAPIYHKSIALAAIFYALLALFLSRRLLLNYFEEKVVALLLLALFLGTNLLHYTVASPGMSHVYNFFLFVLFLSHSLKFLKLPKWKNAIYAGLVLGLIVLIRPSNGIIVLFPLLFGVYDLATVKSRLNFINSNLKSILIALLAFSIVLFPQLLFWKFNTGHWLFYSYGQEGFHFNVIHVLKGLFSFRNGFFIYSPVMLFSVIGFYFLYQKQRELFYPVVVFFLLNIFVVYSWWCWWYGGGFGSRPMIDSLIVLAFPLGALLQVIISRSQRNFVLMASVVGIFCLNSGFNSYQSRRNVIHYDSMTAKAYASSFGKLQIPLESTKLLEHPNYYAALRGVEEQSMKRIDLQVNDSITDGIEEFPFGRSFTQNEIAAFNTDNLVARLDFFADNSLNKSTWIVMVITDGKGEKIQYQYQELLVLSNKIDDWNSREMFFNVDKLKETETVYFYVWNQNKVKVKFRDISISNY